MTTTTVLARSYQLSYAYHADGWYSYINNGEYTSEQQDALVEALMGAQVEELNRHLPKGCYWLPRLGEIHGPATATLDDIDLELALMAAADAVAARFEDIEAKVLGSHDA